MKKRYILLLLIALVIMLPASPSQAYENKVLIMYDSLDPAYFPAKQKTLASLMGHYNLPYDMKRVDQYVSGDTERYRATFYIGNVWDSILPYNFLDDVVTTNRPVTWINFNFWRIGWNPNFSQRFEQKYGFRYLSTVSSFPNVSYKSQTFKRRVDPYYGDPIAKVQILNSNIAKVVATASSTSESIPYIVKANNLTFVTDQTLELWYEDQPYIAFADHLHDQLGISHSSSRKALIRIEDIKATDDPAKLRTMADYLASQNVPFTLAIIPKYVDPQLGNNPPGPTIEVELKRYSSTEQQQDPLKKNATEVVNAVAYMITKGGIVGMHGYTHQYGNVANPWNGITGDDVEFYIYRDGRAISPVPEDSVAWVQDRINRGLNIFSAAGLGRPNYWITPHYEASELDQTVFASNFSAVYQRFPDAYFPYVLNKTYYGGKLIPENLGYADGTITAATIVSRAQKNLVVGDGFASFFVHPRILTASKNRKKGFNGYNLGGLDTMVTGIKNLGYTFVSPNSL